ncbi:MAG: hypothetical protein ACLU37_02540 [Collinsella sp.]
MDLDDLSNRQFAFDSWAAADLDETSAGMPALDIPVNPLFAAAEERNSAYDNTAAYANRPSEQPRAGRIETEDYGQTSSGYSRDPFAATPAPDYTQASVKAASASSYTHGTDDKRAADYHTEEKPPRFSEFSQAAKVVFIAIIIALLGVIAFEGFQLFRGPTASESATQKAEDDNQYLDITPSRATPTARLEHKLCRTLFTCSFTLFRDFHAPISTLFRNLGGSNLTLFRTFIRLISTLFRM